MIVLDTETSGLKAERNGVWQIGALDFENPKNTFLEEARIDDDDEVSDEALKITGKTERELRDDKKQSQKKLLENFFLWCKNVKMKNVLSQCPQILDFPLILIKARKYGLEIPYHYRAFDLHTIASMRYFEINKKFLMDKDHSGMSLSNALKLCGLPDNRMSIDNGIVIKEGKPHNALEDAKLTAECFSRLVYCRTLLEEYSKYKIPEELAR